MSTVLNEKIFTGDWCPLFGGLPLFRDKAPNASVIKCIVVICQARDVWDVAGLNPDEYPGLKLKLAQDVYTKVAQGVDRDELYRFARKQSQPLFDQITADYHVLAIEAIHGAWQALRGMLKDGKPETDVGIIKQVLDAGYRVETAKSLKADVARINLEGKANTLEISLNEKDSLVKALVAAQNAAHPTKPTHPTPAGEARTAKEIAHAPKRAPQKLFYSYDRANNISLFFKNTKSIVLTQQEKKLFLFLKDDRQTLDGIVEHIWEIYKDKDVSRKRNNAKELRSRVNEKCSEIGVEALISEQIDGYYQLTLDVEER